MIGVRYEAAGGKAPGVEHAQHGILALAEHRLGDDPTDGGREHETVAAEPGRDPDAVADSTENRLVVRGDVVRAAHKGRQGNEDEVREQLFERAPHVRPPVGRLQRGIATRSEVAGKNATVGELFGSQRFLRRSRRYRRRGNR